MNSLVKYIAYAILSHHDCHMQFRCTNVYVQIEIEKFVHEI